MTRIAHRLAILLLPLAFVACQPVDDSYGDIYGAYPVGIHSDRIYSGGVYDRYPDPIGYDPYHRGDSRTFRTNVERDAYLRGVAAARRQALRDAELRRQQDRYRRAERDRDRTRRDLGQAERERRRAEWRDRRPVGASPRDREDLERRRARGELRRARVEQTRAERRADREEARLRRLSRTDAAQDRIDRIDRMQRRKEARQRLARTRSDEDEEIRRLLPYRRQGEEIGQFRNRLQQLRHRAENTGVPLRDLLRRRTGPQR